MSEPTRTGAAKRRIGGVDAARGAALVAMMAIHVLPGWNEDFEPTFTWLVFAGRGAALFALLAGVSLAFMSGGQYPPRGERMTAARLGLAVRAVLITVIGLLLGFLVIYAQVILVYYGVMFLLALPLLRLRARTLLILSALIALTAPVLMQATRDSLADMGGVEPNFSTLVQAPGDVLGQVLLSGTYPALPWMAYVCAGLAIGRLDLAERKVQLRLVVAGVGLAVATAALSAFLLGPLGGRDQLVDAASVWSSTPEETVYDTLMWGPDPTLPTDTWWWLASLTPYSSTPLVLLNTIGTAVAFLGILLLLGKAASAVLAPLAVLGKMTLTLYSLHLLLLATGLFEDRPPLSLIVQLMIVAGFAYAWQRFNAQGPLERVVSEASKRVRSTYLERAGRKAAAQRTAEYGAERKPGEARLPSGTPAGTEGQPFSIRSAAPPPPSTPPSIQPDRVSPSAASASTAPPPPPMGRRQALEAEARDRHRNRQRS
ncbi:heparan-alpha-glucosaminide N-acetyltransferase domain-containing protein [Arthrobacter sp. zg-Y1143]|uniref:heparan-alpha-glucosaminide N-acetyltransferase domain-containing protein n=1 Tax=Arthrobacter sp. zg-Y1143 TaxID=3049065 RepID=UPI0024C4118A|nr:heparan-alpha-glucosaminide N-acetyltransferase domain-containing protein [Arthrobacter sp. zg-Y1143]MDK1328664.1 heparan-alpha-glucosaminide N-acetyltransferase domain-containing protein [Arthrobacter sp. zg-Y1143]